MKPTTDLASLPKKIWGKATTEVSGWTTSVTADVEGTDFENTQYTVDAENGDLSIKLSASGGMYILYMIDVMIGCYLSFIYVNCSVLIYICMHLFCFTLLCVLNRLRNNKQAVYTKLRQLKALTPTEPQ